MRIEGALKSWNHERGSGLITPETGGEDVFVHIKAFGKQAPLPEIGQRLSFEVGVTWEGKLRARHVQLLSERGGVWRWPSARGVLGFVVLPLFMLLVLAVALRWSVPAWVGGLYAATSALCFLIHALDRQAAAPGRWRVSEPVLLLLGLAGGWPGAIVAQQLLRLQTIRPAYRALFWGGVLLNMLGLVLLNSPWLAQ